jgi:hypothetical protein
MGPLFSPHILDSQKVVKGIYELEVTQKMSFLYFWCKIKK